MVIIIARLDRPIIIAPESSRFAPPFFDIFAYKRQPISLSLTTDGMITVERKGREKERENNGM